MKKEASPNANPNPAIEKGEWKLPLVIGGSAAALVSTGIVLSMISHDSYHPAPLKPGMEYSAPTNAAIGARLSPVETAIAQQALQLADHGRALKTSLNGGLATEVDVHRLERHGSIRYDAMDATIIMGNTDGKPDPSKVELIDMVGNTSNNGSTYFNGHLILGGLGGEQDVADRRILTDNYAVGYEAGIYGYYTNTNSPPKDPYIALDTTDPTRQVNNSPDDTANTIAQYASDAWEQFNTGIMTQG